MEWTEEMRQFLAEEQYGISRAELTERINARFGLDLTPEIVHSACKRYGLKNGRDGRFQEGRVSHNKGKKMSAEQYARMAPTMFKKGQKAGNHMPVGSRTWRNCNGKRYEFEKTAEPNVWEFLYHLNWERENGPIPEGHVLIFVDGNTENSDLSNLMLETRTQHVIRNHCGLKGYDRESTEIAQTIADLKAAIYKRGKKHGASRRAGERK